MGFKIHKLSRLLNKDLKPSAVIVGYYQHPGKPNLLVHPYGACIRKDIPRELKVKIDKHGYHYLESVGMVYRAVAETMLHNPHTSPRMHVNHLSGIKSDSTVFNLEWCTPKENCDHAYDLLRDDNIPVDVRNLETGEVLQFRSIIKAAKFIGVNPGLVSSTLKRGLHRQYVVGVKYEIKQTHESWILTKNSIGKESGPGNKCVVVQKIGYPQYFLFTSVPQASKHLGIKPHMFYSYLNGGTVDMRKHGYNVWYMVDIDVPITEMIDMRAPRPQKHFPRRVPPMIRVHNGIDGKTTIYNSIEEFATMLGVSKQAVICGMNANQGRYRVFKIEFINDV